MSTPKPRKSLAQMAADAAGRGLMQCPVCGCRDLRVLRSEGNSAGDTVLRTRYCRNCGRNGPRIYTSEKPDRVVGYDGQPTDTGIGDS